MIKDFINSVFTNFGLFIVQLLYGNCDVMKYVRRIYVNMVNNEQIKCYTVQPFDFSIKHHKFVCNNDLCGVSPHVHDNCEIYVSLSKEAYISVENNTYPMSYGYVCITRPGEKHSCIYDDKHFPNSHEYYAIHFSARGNESLLDLFFKRPAGQNNLLILPFEISERIIFLCSALIRTSENSLKAQFDFWNILCMLTENFQNKDMTRLNKYPDMFVTLNYINKNFTEPIYMETLAKISDVSVSTLERHFLRIFNMTPKEYVKQKRLEYAAQLLQNGESVSNAALKSGFNDYSRFISIFKKQFGITPLKYQKAKWKSSG